MADHQWGRPALLPSDEGVLNAPVGWARPLAEVVKALFRLRLFQAKPFTTTKHFSKLSQYPSQEFSLYRAPNHSFERDAML